MDTPPPLPGDPVRAAFPGMTPVKNPPTLFTLNGFGLTMCGRRDHDVNTGTYIKTYCICAIFIPLIALTAYRVADAPGGGWYFLGREQLSRFARRWNALLGLGVALLAATIVQGVYRSTPEYRARVELKEAAARLEEGDSIGAANAYRRMLVGVSPLKTEAEAGFERAIESALEDNSPKTAAAIITHVNTLPPAHEKPALKTRARQHGLTICEQVRTSNPEGALAIVSELSRWEPDLPELASLKPEILRACIAATPDKLEHVLELAAWHEEHQQVDECFALLSPRSSSLGNSEGARMLGQILVSKGEFDAAYQLLFPYVDARLDDLHQVERAFTNASAHAYQRAISTLEQGKGPAVFYSEYDRATKARQMEMVDQYVSKSMDADRSLTVAREKLVAANAVVGVALDLGLTQLRRAQAMTEAEARNAELSAAEKTFLAIGGLAGETDQYRMFLGQVYYWLGRHDDGRKLFDELLATSQRPFPLLMALSDVLREVGEQNFARELTEEAWQKATKAEDKQTAASKRSFLHKDTEDRILWLGRSDTNSPFVKVELYGALGNQALERGERESAARHFRQAIAGYQDLQKTSAQMNNQALLYFQLHSLTNQSTDRERGVQLLEEAVALAPGDSILTVNIASTLISEAVREVIGDALRLDVLGDSPSISDLFYLYEDDAGRAALCDRLKSNDLMKRALSYVDKAILLAPKSPGPYVMAHEIHKLLRDEAALQRLHHQLQQVSLDQADQRESAIRYFRGEMDEKYRQAYVAQINRFESLRDNPTVVASPLTRTFLANSISGLYQSAYSIGLTVDADKLVTEAQSNFERDSGNASGWALTSAYCFRANRDLLARDPDYAKLVGAATKSVSARQLLACALESNAGLAARVAAHPDVQAALKLEQARRDRFASSPSTTAWALAVGTDPTHAADLKARCLAATWMQAADQIEATLNSMSASIVLERYWFLKMKGDPAAATAELTAARERGLPLPAL